MTASTAKKRQMVLHTVSPSGAKFEARNVKTVGDAMDLQEQFPDVGFGYKVVARKAPLRPETVEVGDGVTMTVGSDRYAGTVFEVSPSGKTFKFTLDKAKAAEGHDYYGSQKYEYEPVEPYDEPSEWGGRNTNVEVARWSEKSQCFKRGQYSRVFGGRNAYQDPHF